ncbi:MAG: hypothetical protein ACP5O0_02060 [Acidimicrobiales bacterium]
MSTYLSAKEKKIGFILLGLTALAYIYVWFGPVFLHTATKVPHPALYLGGGLAMMAIAGWSLTRTRRLIAGALCMIVAFGPWGKFVVLPFPLLAYGAFTAFKRDQQEIARKRQEAAAKREARQKSSGKAKAVQTGVDGRPLPTPSKRYTPPARTRPKSRRAN